MSSINTAYKGDFLSWTINLVESKKLVISDVFLDRLDLVKAELPLLEHVIVMKTGAQEGPDPLAQVGAARGAARRGPRRRARRGRVQVDRRRPDHVHLGHHRPLQGRHQAERGRLLLGPRPARGGLGDGRQVGRVAGRGHLLQLPAALPLQRPGALGLPGAGRRRPGRLRGALLARARFWQQIIDAEATIFNSIGAVSYFIWNIPPSDLDRAHKVHTCFAAPAPKDIYNEFQERFGVKFIEGYGLTETGMATYMDPTKPGVPGSMGKANPGYEVTIVEPGTDRPLPPGHAGRDRGRHEDPEHRHARLLRHAGEDRRGLPQPEAPHRRPRAHGRRRLLLLHGPREGLHPPPRRERLLDGGRAPGRPTTRTSRRSRRSG